MNTRNPNGPVGVKSRGRRGMARMSAGRLVHDSKFSCTFELKRAKKQIEVGAKRSSKVK